MGNIDADPQLEIIATGLASGPLYAWNHDGSLVAGWPANTPNGAGYAALGQIANDDEALEVFSGFMTCCGTTEIAAYDGDGKPTPGWPRTGQNYVASPPTAADIDGDGLHELFIEEESANIHAYTATGGVLRGWPQGGTWAQDMHTPAVGDLNNDGDYEIVSASGRTDDGMYVVAWHHTGERIDGFPVRFMDAWPDTFPVIGDVDGDGEQEIVVVFDASGTGSDGAGGNTQSRVAIISRQGEIERRIELGAFSGATAPALADLTRDQIPEIVVAAGNRLVVTTGLGEPLPGWPVDLGQFNKGDSSPVVGDVDGDGGLDIALTGENFETEKSEIRVYNADGSPVSGFPKVVPAIGSGGVPAIADIDLDGRNELIVSGMNWQGIVDMYDRVWVYDLNGAGPYGGIEWGQFGGGPTHSMSYPPSTLKWPTTAPLVRELDRTVSMRLERHLFAVGRVSSDFSICKKNVRVHIQSRNGAGSWNTLLPLGKGKTNKSGRYRIELPDSDNTLRAQVPFVRDKRNRVCAREISATRRHEH